MPFALSISRKTPPKDCSGSSIPVAAAACLPDVVKLLRDSGIEQPWREGISMRPSPIRRKSINSYPAIAINIIALCRAITRRWRAFH